MLHVLRKETGVTVRALEAAVYKAKKWGVVPPCGEGDGEEGDGREEGAAAEAGGGDAE